MDEWRDQAACKSSDPEMFYDRDRAAEAIAVCGTCDVIAECKAFARRLGVDEGVWGGLLKGRFPPRDQPTEPRPKGTATHCVNGHPRSGENLRIDAKGRRHCQACRRMWAQRQDEKRREARSPR